MPTRLPYIPEYITVHLGAPDSDAENVTLPFLDYVANVASSEIYPSWPENALRANIYAQISYALNRVYTEYYRSRGYDFDITSSTAFDQSFVKGRDIFENISRLSGELFDDYIRRQGNVEPLFAQYCDGIEVSCDGLSQWGSVSLAKSGRTPYEILTNYYGNDIDIVRGAPVMGITASLPEVPLRPGSAGNDVRQIQIRLNRISDNFTSIPKIALPDGIFSYDTESAVKSFQEIFGLTPDGIVGPATWYKIQIIYNSVKKLSDLNSEGLTFDEIKGITFPYPEFGDRGLAVRNLQYYLDYLSRFYQSVPPVSNDGIFGDVTRSAVIAIQKEFGLPANGIVDRDTWNALYNAYLGIIDQLEGQLSAGDVIPFPGVILRLGSESDEVALIQRYLNTIADTYTDIPKVDPTGYFGTATQNAVLAFQRIFGLPDNGIIDASVWDEIMTVYSDLQGSLGLGEGQYPGFEVGA